MTVLLPGDPRAMRRVGTWTDSQGKEHPVMRDGHGRDHRCVSGSIADMHRPDFIERLFDQLAEAKRGE